jgi:hypothetical protein
VRVPERRRRPDLDERFSLYPLEGEDVLAALLGSDGDDAADADDV